MQSEHILKKMRSQITISHTVSYIKQGTYLAMAANAWEKDLSAKFKSVWTNTSIFNGLCVGSTRE